MHELSIAQNILDIIKDYRPSDRPSRIRTVHLQLGDQSGVVADSLTFCFKAVTEGTMFEGAELDIERIPFSIRCKECGATTSNEAGLFRCAACEGTEVDIVSGTELQVAAMEIVDEGAAT
ncbi:MAG TPA: hydrogenase maturation nickel metallochaperone HypA [Bacteroidota bacterium]|nr:hydrogenase maturation nickel metallochaperone HypA [Bacteroidota bacterium]